MKKNITLLIPFEENKKHFSDLKKAKLNRQKKLREQDEWERYLAIQQSGEYKDQQIERASQKQADEDYMLEQLARKEK